MLNNNNSIKSLYLNLIIYVMVYILIFGIITVARDYSKKEEETIPVFEYNSDLVLVTVAHIPETSFSGYTLVWSDTENDRAIYVKQDFKSTADVQVGDIVAFNGITCDVTAVDEQGFAISLRGELAKHGMSGSEVQKSGVTVGLISRALGISSIYCVFI